MRGHPSTVQADMIAVGAEMLTEFRTETNSLFVTSQLNALGISVRRKVVVGDDEDLIAQTLLASLQEVQIVILSGGLGPTSDDVTREGVSAALGLRLELDAGVIEHLEKLYERFGYRMTENNRRQALVPQGATVLRNPRGTAPGLFLKKGDSLVFLLPGPPRELKPMVVEKVVPLIREHFPVRVRPSRQLRVASMAESAVDARAEPIYKQYPEVETTILSSPGVIDLFFFWGGEDAISLAESRLDDLTAEIKKDFGKSIFADGPDELESVVGTLLREKKLCLATAESCTGGLLSKLVTDVPGSSEYYLGGVVSYANALKTKWLDVSPRDLEEFGAVSQRVAARMARGICESTGADIGLSITGIAGPEGGSLEKPLGTIFLGLFDGTEPKVWEKRLPGGRETVRLRSARLSLDLLRRHLI